MRSRWNIGRLCPAIILLCSCLLFTTQCIDYINFTVDDVFISLRVAVNAAAGFGMVYNRGELVEGHSDPSWVFMLAAIIRAGIVDRSSPWTLLWTAKILSA